MLQLWLQMDKFPVTEQRLADQGNQIRMRKWLSDLELEEIKRMFDEGEPLNEVASSEYKETEVLNETNVFCTNACRRKGQVKWKIAVSRRKYRFTKRSRNY